MGPGLQLDGESSVVRGPRPRAVGDAVLRRVHCPLLVLGIRGHSPQLTQLLSTQRPGLILDDALNLMIEICNLFYTRIRYAYIQENRKNKCEKNKKVIVQCERRNRDPQKKSFETSKANPRIHYKTKNSNNYTVNIVLIETRTIKAYNRKSVVAIHFIASITDLHMKWFYPSTYI